MWRLVVSELSEKSMYKGQRIMFMGTIKAQIRAIYSHGRKIQSAFFGKCTKPIFRSESARYVVFIQMSKEMWDFEPEGTGELMFNKVINGFLPELFSKWQGIGARHLVSIILFTRMEYEREIASTVEYSKRVDEPDFCTGFYNGTKKLPYKDFYRVLVSDMASGQWTAILTQLKREFKTFLRDVTICVAPIKNGTSDALESNSEKVIDRKDIIAGRPAAATYGNILEAINVASSQFSGDHIDRDLVRTGLSIIIITPGTGIFEVDSELLNLTTDVLMENGVGIDLVCLSRMPLHSVPLFKYRLGASPNAVASSQNIYQITAGLGNSFHSIQTYGSPNQLPKSNTNFHNPADNEKWLYAIPHWIDVSFWDPGSEPATSINRLTGIDLVSSSSRRFVPRVRMYEVQMMGIMENEMSDISMPYLDRPTLAPSGIDIVWDGTTLSQRGSVSSFSSSSRRGGSLRMKASHLSSASFSPSKYPRYTISMEAIGSLIQWIEEYDDALFEHPLHRAQLDRTSRHSRKQNADIPRKDQRSEETKSSEWHADVSRSRVPLEGQRGSNSMLDVYQRIERMERSDPKGPSPHKLPHISRGYLKSTGLSRQISFGLRGFSAAAPKAIPVTEVSSEVAHPESLISRGMKSGPTSIAPRTPRPVKRRDPAMKAFESTWNEAPERSGTSQNPVPEQTSNPVSIVSGLLDSSRFKVGEHERLVQVQEKSLSDGGYEDVKSTRSGSSPREDLASWLTVLNPSNPQKFFADPTARLGRWHHVFPRPLHASNIKWKSLCSPASIPLTTEDFPSSDNLKTDYHESRYTIIPTADTNTPDDGKPSEWLIREMINARFCHGFQIVVGARVPQVPNVPRFQEAWIFAQDLIGSGKTEIYMSRGRQIHCLSVHDAIEIRQYIRTKTMGALDSSSDNFSISYKPSVRTTLAEGYLGREIMLSSTQETYDWQRLDEFIANHENQRSTSYPGHLRFWRARFVLIPVQSPSNSKGRAQPSNEDNEEEVRLEGIRKLTQIWQKNRYIAPEERRFQSASRIRKDPNPLDIIYRTRHPSAVVEAELSETLLLEDEVMDSKPTQLLPDSDRFERSNLTLASLAQAVQGDRGVKMIDRRWHLKLHYNCFIGLEFTTWLLDNFRDVDSREEAVELGNELMKGGLFVHVERRHNFRDGNFFYQIANEYRAPRIEPRSSWFGRMSSVPSTPIADNMRNLSGGLYTRPSTSDEDNPDVGSFIPTGKGRPSVALSKSLVYDIDHRKRSYRQELITIHYDRISSADDCYHLRIDWMNVTPKLIEDALTNWATLGERFGLRLVELPINEASKVNEIHPFRGPYIVRLAKQPPEEQVLCYSDNTSLTPSSTTSYPYHKELLKKFNFVLDLEAARDFPPSVDVSYSWGAPDYQYPQFISRDGVLLAQITTDGDFLLFANRLYNNRGVVGPREASRPLEIISADGNGYEAYKPPTKAVESSQGTSVPISPYASPTIAATSDVGLGLDRSDLITPERIKNELEAFCLNPDALEKFFCDVLRSRNSLIGLSTPSAGNFACPTGPPPALNLTDN